MILSAIRYSGKEKTQLDGAKNFKRFSGTVKLPRVPRPGMTIWYDLPFKLKRREMNLGKNEG